MEIKSLGALGIVVALSGCANAFGVKSNPLAPAQSVTVATMPAGALATNGHGNSCVTPCQIPLMTDRGGEITVALGGFQTERVQVTSSVSERRLAMRSANVAVEAIDPDPASILLTALGHAASGKGGVMSLDNRHLELELTPLAEGEEDLLAPAVPSTGERIPIDISGPDLDAEG